MKKLILIAVAALISAACTNRQEIKNNENMKQELNLTQEWDKVFPLSKKVSHRKVTFETQYGLTRMSGNGYYDSDDNEEARHAAREAMAKQRLGDPMAMAGGVINPLPDDAPQFVKDYHAYYKTPRGYHVRSGNSNDGWRVIGTQAYANARFLYYINEIRSAVLVMHGEKAHSRYFGEAAYHYMVEGKAESYNFIGNPNPNPENKQLLIIPGATHCDLYDGGEGNYIPWDTLAEFFGKNL